MIERYALPELQEQFSERRKLQLWLQIELLAAEALNRAGVIPDADWERIHQATSDASVDPARAHEIERESQHDVLAFLRSITERLGAEGRWLHYGLTSSDVLDTATAVTLRDATLLVERELARLAEVARHLALQHRTTRMIGRSHGIHAEPITFGFKAAGWYAELARDQARLARAREEIGVGKISGAVGSHANVSSEVERFVCEALGLEPDPAATQVVSRDRHAELLTALAILGGTLERIAIEIRHLQRTEVGEVFEPFGAGQQGSSAMPHKRNPVLAERVTGLARLLRGDALVALENMALWHERDISHSSAERVVFPDACAAVDFMAIEMTKVLQGLEVRPERMLRNLQFGGGVVFSGRVLTALVESGMSREDAYAIVQKAAMESLQEGGPGFRPQIEKNRAVMERIGARLDEVFDPWAGLENTDLAFERLSLGVKTA